MWQEKAAGTRGVRGELVSCVTPLGLGALERQQCMLVAKRIIIILTNKSRSEAFRLYFPTLSGDKKIN